MKTPVKILYSTDIAGEYKGDEIASSMNAAKAIVRAGRKGRKLFYREEGDDICGYSDAEDMSDEDKAIVRLRPQRKMFQNPRKRLPIPQREFGFGAGAFNLAGDTTDDGERTARERDEKERSWRHAATAQTQMFQNPRKHKGRGTTRLTPELKADLEKFAREDGIQRGAFFDTSGRFRTEQVSATSTHHWLFKTAAGKPFHWPDIKKNPRKRKVKARRPVKSKVRRVITRTTIRREVIAKNPARMAQTQIYEEGTGVFATGKERQSWFVATGAAGGRRFSSLSEALKFARSIADKVTVYNSGGREVISKNPRGSPTVNSMPPFKSVEFRHAGISVGVLARDLSEIGLGDHGVNPGDPYRFDPPLTLQERQRVINGISYLREAFGQDIATVAKVDEPSENPRSRKHVNPASRRLSRKDVGSLGRFLGFDGIGKGNSFLDGKNWWRFTVGQGIAKNPKRATGSVIKIYRPNRYLHLIEKPTPQLAFLELQREWGKKYPAFVQGVHRKMIEKDWREWKTDIGGNIVHHFKKS